MLKIQRSFLVAAAVFALAAAPSLSQLAGDLDESFADGGIYALLPDDGELYARAVKIDDSGRIVVVGTAFEPTFAGPIAVRLLPDGTPDEDFGAAGTGVVRVEFPEDALETPDQVPVISVEASDFVIDDAGRMVVVGLAQLPGNNSAFAAFRLSSEGTLDTAYGNGGLSLVDPTPFADSLLTAEIQRIGNRQAVVAAGRIVQGGAVGTSFTVIRLLPDGSFDLSFGTDGLFVEDFPTWRFSSADDLLIENNQKIVVVGRTAFTDRGDADFFAVALRRDGTLDPSFGTGGQVTVDFGGTVDGGYGAAFDGRAIIAVGSANELGASLTVPGITDLAMVKLTPQGALDDAFGIEGKLRLHLGSLRDNAWDVLVQPDGRIVAAGRSTLQDVEDTDITLVRVEQTGALDSSFGDFGIVKTNYSGYDEAYAAALQSDGKIVVAGYGGADGFGFNPATTADLLVARYLGLASLETEIGTLQDLVREMASEGMIQRRRARSLISKLDLAIYFLERNGEPVALQFLRLFRVETMLATAFGQIQPAAGAELTEQIDVLIAALRSR